MVGVFVIVVCMLIVGAITICVIMLIMMVNHIISAAGVFIAS